MNQAGQSESGANRGDRRSTDRRLGAAFWRRWHRWIGWAATVFLGHRADRHHRVGHRHLLDGACAARMRAASSGFSGNCRKPETGSRKPELRCRDGATSGPRRRGLTPGNPLLRRVTHDFGGGLHFRRPGRDRLGVVVMRMTRRIGAAAAENACVTGFELTETGWPHRAVALIWLRRARDRRQSPSHDRI